MGITQQDVEYLLALKSTDITRSFMITNFARTVKGPAKFKTTDKFTIPKGKYKDNPQSIQTTIGIFVFNKFFIEDDFHEIFGYINETINSKKFEDIDDKLSKALLNDKITAEQMAAFLDKVQWFGFSFNSILCPSLTEKTMKPLKSVAVEKQKLMKENKAILEKGDAVAAAQMEKKLLDIARKEIGKDPGMELYESGSKASFDNNYKSLFVMKGPIMDTATGKYMISTSNYMDGVKKEEIHAYADTIVNGAYSKGVGTQISGYMTKKYYAAFQSLVLDKKGSDCKSSNLHKVVLTNKNYKLFLYRYIVENGKLVNLDDTTIKNYIGREVKLRDAIYCTSDKICNVCAGDMYYKLNIQNIGLTSTKISSSLMQKSLKKFHDTSVKLYKVNVDDLVL